MSTYLDSSILKINSLKLHNFMGVDGELFIDFKDTEEFIGDNGAGKSTILDAIAFVFCYTDAFGNSASKVSFSHAGEVGTETWVEMEARIDNINTILKRTFSVTATGKQTSTLYVDHREMKATEWKGLYDKDVFLSLINPKYISSLSIDKAKDLLVKFIEMKATSKRTLKKEPFTDILVELDNEAMEYLLEELAENEIDVIKQHLEALLKSNKDKIKEKQGEIKKLKLVPKVEEPENEYHIKGLLFTEEAAFETLMNDFADNPSKKNKDFIRMFLEQKSQRAVKMEQHRTYNAAIDNISKLEDEIMDLENEDAEIGKKMGYVDSFYEEILKQIDITSIVPDIKLSFKDKLGNDDFQILYKEVPIKECSFAEQVRAGILLADFFMNYVDINYPIFIDNAECITELPKLLNDFHQMVSFTVEKGISLSRYVGDVVENLKTLETMPRSHVKGRVKTRLLGTDFSESE